MRSTATSNLNSHQRAAFITLALWQGSKLSTRDVARLCGMTRQGAERMMAFLSASLPIVYCDAHWQWMERD